MEDLRSSDDVTDSSNLRQQKNVRCDTNMYSRTRVLVVVTSPVLWNRVEEGEFESANNLREKHEDSMKIDSKQIE